MAGVFKGKIFFALVLSAFLLISIAFALVIRSKKSVTIELGMFSGSNWGVSNGESYHTADKAIAVFEKKHPNVKVHYFSGIRKNDYSEWLSQQILLGKTPDVFFVPDEKFSTLVQQGILKNLTPVISKDREIKSWEYFPPSWEAVTFGEKQFALPYQTDCTVMAVNMTLLKQKGLSLPSRDWTWNDFYSLAKETGQALYSWQDAVYSNGVLPFSHDGNKANFSDSRVADAIRFMQKLSALDTERRYSASDFDKGLVAFTPMSYAQFCTYVSYPYKVYKDSSFEWACLPMPAGISGGNVSRTKTLSLSIYAKTRHAKLSYELLKTLVHDISVQTDIYSMGQGASPLRIVPASAHSISVIDSYTKSSKEYSLALIAEILNSAESTPKFSRYTEAVQTADSEIKSIIDERKDAETSLKVLQHTLENILAK